MVASDPWAICVCRAFGQRLVIRPCPLSYITLAGQSFQGFLKQGVSCGSGWHPTGSSGVTAGMGAWGAGIRFPPRDGTGHRASQGLGLRSAPLPSEPHIFHRKVEGHWLGVRSVRACPGSFPTRCRKQMRSRGSGELAHFRFARVARGGGPESKLPRETWGWASDSGSNGRLRVKDQGSQWEVRGAGPSWDHTQVSWGHVGAGVLGSRRGRCPGVGPFAAADLGGWWSLGQGQPQACGSGPEARPPTWPPDAPGQCCPPGVQGRPQCRSKGSSFNPAVACPGLGGQEPLPHLLLLLGYTFPNQAPLKGVARVVPRHTL